MLRQKLAALSDKARSKKQFDEDTRNFAKTILYKWLEKSVEAANAGEKFLELVSFEIGTMVGNNKILNFVNNGDLLSYIEKETELSAELKCFLILKNKKIIQEIQPVNFGEFHENHLLIIYHIRLVWE